MPIKLSERHEPVTRAKIAIKDGIVKAVTENGLTYAELVHILAEEIQSWTKFQIREERQGL